MATSLTDLIDRLGVLLMDVGGSIWDSTYLTKAIGYSVREYSKVNPLMMETVITLPGDGREIALDSLAELIDVSEVWWPYHSAISAPEDWPPNKVRGFRVWWDDGRPVLFLEILDGTQPQATEQVRVYYSRTQCLLGWDGAATTIPAIDENAIVTGAAGNAVLARSLDLAETAGTDLYAVTVLGVWGRQKLREFYNMLEEIRSRSARRSVPWGSGWQLDKWD